MVDTCSSQFISAAVRVAISPFTISLSLALTAGGMSSASNKGICVPVRLREKANVVINDP